MSNPVKNTDSKRAYAAIRGGDEAAFRRFYEERLVYLVGKIQKLTNDRDEAWDIVQDTFVRLWEERERIDPDKPLDGFVAAMATHAAYDAHRKKQIHARYHREQQFVQTEEDHHADAKMIERETRRKIDAIIEAMPPQRRTVYRLSREENLSYREIADRLGITPGTVHRHMSIALEELRSMLSVLSLFVIPPMT
jgi:RNA polymerase sigma-70 factor (ECF subfamily)